jgi:hypothetical protein
MFRRPTRPKRSFGFGRRSDDASHRRRNRFVPAPPDGLELRQLLSLTHQSSNLVASFSADAAGGSYSHAIGQDAPGITPIADSSSKSATDPTTGTSGSYSIGLVSAISGTQSDTGSVTLSGSFQTANATDFQGGNFTATYEIIGTADSSGNLVVNFTDTSSSSQNSSVTASFSDGGPNQTQTGTYSYPLTQGQQYVFFVNLNGSNNLLTGSDSSASASGSIDFSWHLASSTTPPPPIATPSITVVPTPNPSTYGQPVTFTATVSAAASGLPTPTGLVTFEDGSTVLNPGGTPLNASGIATFTTSTLAVDTHSITAVYGGDGNFSSVTSSPVMQTVTPAPTPPPSSVEIDINDTASNADNITLFNPPSTGEKYVQTIPAKITNTGTTAGTFQLSVSPAGAASLSQTSVTLAAGAGSDAWTEIAITPEADSSAPNDVHIIASQGGVQVGEDDMTIVGVTFSTTQGVNSLDIRNADTPATMTQDRIPPFGPASTSITPLYVTVTPDLSGSGQSASLTFLNQTESNGYASFENGSTSAVVTSTSVVNLTGLQQTAATGFFIPLGSLSTVSIPVNVGNNAGQLMLAVDVRDQNTLVSKGFSVAAIPVNFICSNPRIYTGDRLHKGMVVEWGLESDSGNIQDLNAVDVTEVVKTVEATGRLRYSPLSTSTWFPAARFVPGVYFDRHLVPTLFYIRRDESSEQDQAFEFRDTRTGANDISMPNSGFIIRQDIYKRLGSRQLMLTTTKAGAPVTVDGISTEAGFTSPTMLLTVTQRVRRLL